MMSRNIYFSVLISSLYSRHLQQAAGEIPPKIKADHKLSRSQKKLKST